ncbi:hypothetical protein AUC71_08480 [Methyloceanibacter marginalis]|uniref:Uncharacterized protein n=1 Tax=Methyloceanibacter marginalis TaxID=1774971 RepID=A0A1E3WCY1_9HYPH|nr:hypothetical protein [Methyloceanibacter marginalis]ODS03658.1 hypothetical protein AUC71_08480 [Methyloceanibacter marginalis]
MVAQLVQPVTIDLAKGPDIDRRAALIAMLLGEHASECAAEQALAFVARTDQHVGKAFQPGQHRNEARSYGVMVIFCLHALLPAAWVCAGRPTRVSLANQEDSTSSRTGRAAENG